MLYGRAGPKTRQHPRPDLPESQARFMFDNFLLNILSLTCIIFNAHSFRESNSLVCSCSCLAERAVSIVRNRGHWKGRRVRNKPFYRSKM